MPRAQTCNLPPCPLDEIAIDEQPPPEPIDPINPPGDAAWYNGSEALPPQSVVATTPYDCSRWLGSRIYLEGQAWFTLPGADKLLNSTQLHIGACVPHKRMIAGQFPIDILLQKVNWPM